MENGKNRGIGHNSENVKEKDNANYVSGMDLLLDAIKSVTSLFDELVDIQKYHTASHGDDYYFADELKNPKDVERYPGSPVEYGKTRRPNSFEKKNFAGKTNHHLDIVQTKSLNIRSQLMKAVEKLEGKDE